MIRFVFIILADLYDPIVAAIIHIILSGVGRREVTLGDFVQEALGQWYQRRLHQQIPTGTTIREQM